MAIKVKLRQKEIKDNRLSLYLDYYPPTPHPETGELTRRNFLGLYLYASIKKSNRKIKNGKTKEFHIYDLDPVLNATYELHNVETLQLAEEIRRKKENELNKPEIYTGYEKEQLRLKTIGEKNFVVFFKDLADKKKSSNHDNWISTYNYLNQFTGGILKFGELNEGFCDDFKFYLLNTKSIKSCEQNLSRNTCASYFNKFKEALKQAYREGLLQSSLNERIDPILPEETIKNTLTVDELNVLAKTECPSPLLRKAALFFALTGLPYMEMKNLEWQNIEVTKSDGIIIRTKRQKVNKPYVVYISLQAYELLGEPQQPADKVFAGLSNSDRYENFELWLALAGIKKKLTFHDLRHTYGTNQIEAGTDIYVLKGNMAHSNVKYTQQYGHQSDKRKMEAAEKVKLDL